MVDVQNEVPTDFITNIIFSDLASAEKFFDSIPSGISITVDTSCKEIKHNRKAAEFLRIESRGSPLHSADGNQPLRLFHKGKQLSLSDMPVQRAAWKGEEVKNREIEFLWDDGVQKYALFSSNPVYNNKGEIIGAVATFEDITGLKQVEKALKKSRQKEQLFSNVAGCLLTSENPLDIIKDLCLKTMEFLDMDLFLNYLVDEEKNCLHMHACAGIPEEEAQKIEWLDYGAAVCGYAAQEARPIVVENIPEAPDPRTELVKSYGIKAYACNPLRIEDRVIGTISFGACSRTAFTAEELTVMKTIADYIAVALDRLRMNRALRESEDTYRKLSEKLREIDLPQSEERFYKAFHNNLVAIAITHFKEGKYVDVNEAWLKMYGFKREEVIGRSAGELNLYVDSELQESSQKELKNKGRYSNFEVTYKTRKGEIGVCLSSGELIMLDGETCIFSLEVDITERKRAEDLLRKREEQLKQITDNIHDTIMVMDKQGIVQYLSPSYESVMGVAIEEKLGRSAFENVHPEDAKTVISLFAAGISGYIEAGKLEYRCRHADGHYVWLETTGRALFDDRGIFAGAVICIRDITGRKQAEEELRLARDGLEFRVRERTAELQQSNDRLKTEIEERKKAEEVRKQLLRDIDEQRARLQAIIESLPVGLRIADASGKIVFINDVARNIWGENVHCAKNTGDYSAYKAWWPETGECILAEDMPIACALLRGAACKEKVIDFERFNGTRGTQLVSSAPIRMSDGAITGCVAIVQDITELKLAEQALREQTEALAEIDRAKTAFFSNVSHEFRTPLMLIISPLEDLLFGTGWQIFAEVREQLTLIHSNSLRLLKLVNTLLDFSRIEAGRNQAAYEPADLAAYTAELAGVFRSAIESAGMRLKVDCPPLPQPIYIDKEMWEKIVLNLLSNAFKFTFEGEITVALRWCVDHAELEVKDTGAGIAPEEMPHIFERFYCIRGVRARTHEGTGIGLALVQELVKLHGGTVKATSEPGKGASFTVLIPAGSAHLPKDRIGTARTLPSKAMRAANLSSTEALKWLTEDAAVLHNNRVVHEDVPQPAAGVPAGKRARVLLADDNADMRGYIRRLLSDNYDVEAVADGRAALTAARENPPDLILTDIMMPRLDGFELLAELRSDPTLQTVPVIMLSARAEEESRVVGLNAGADDYLVKPFSARELIARVNANLEISLLRKKVFFEQAARNEAENYLKTEKEMARLDRLNLVGEMAASIGHEIRNPMTSVRGFLELFNTKPTFAEYREIFDLMISEMDRANFIITEYLSLAKDKSVDLKPMNLNAVLNAIFPLLQADSFEQDKHLYLETQDIPDLLLDGKEIRQLIYNLARNGLEAMKSGGKLTIKTYLEGEEAVLSVQDEGKGIDPEILEKLGTPFLTTKENGTGLGLPVCYSIAKRHGAKIDIESGGAGTTIKVLFKISG